MSRSCRTPPRFLPLSRLVAYFCISLTFFFGTFSPWNSGSAGTRSFFCEAQDVCRQSDFVRTSSTCSGDGKRTVSYVKNASDTCVSPVSYVNQEESCDCTPEDYSPSFSLALPSMDDCRMTFQSNGCTESTVVGASAQVQVDTALCEKHSPCGKPNILMTYGKCDYEKDPITKRKVSESKKVEIIPYFDSACNPFLPSSVPLPPISYMPCDAFCGSGSYMGRDGCKECVAGTYSMGGGIRFQTFLDIDQNFMQTKCEFTNSSGTQSCDGWYASDGTLNVGPYDPPNDWLPPECDAHPENNCHNNLKASLTLRALLVKDGYIKFTYLVESEAKFDGLSFFIDESEEPVMALEYYQPNPVSLTFNLTAGYHKLTWVYSKDAKYSGGYDWASIRMIEVAGLDFNNYVCLPCPVGFYSPNKASECIPCGINEYNDEIGAGTCKPCPSGTYSLHAPRIECKVSPKCNFTEDSEILHGRCDPSTLKRTKTTVWREPKICDSSEIDAYNSLPRREEEDCPLCPGGQFRSRISGNCEFCPPGLFRASSDPDVGVQSCKVCPPGSVALKTVSLLPLLDSIFTHRDAQWNISLPSYLVLTDAFPSSFPFRFDTGCSGECEESGWRVSNSVLYSGKGHGPTVSVWLSLRFELDSPGSVSVDYSVDIPSGDQQRGFFFYVDDKLVQDVEDDPYGGSPAMDLVRATLPPFPLSKGKHRLMFVWVKLNADNEKAHRDSAEVYDIRIRGTSVGGASQCNPIDGGFFSTQNRSVLHECPPGHFSEQGNSEERCQPCPANTYKPDKGGDSSACLACLEGTTSLPGSRECMIGNADTPLSFCTYTLPFGDARSGLPIVYDIAPLLEVAKEERALGREEARQGEGDRGSVQQEEEQSGEGEASDPFAESSSLSLPSTFFGPVPNLPSSAQQSNLSIEYQPLFFVSPCARNRKADFCKDNEGKPLDTYACVTHPSIIEGFGPAPSFSSPPSISLSSLISHRYALNLGLSVSLHPLGTDDALVKRGFKMHFKGDECAGSKEEGKEMELDLYFICDMNAGFGQPGSWTALGKQNAFDPNKTFGEWADKVTLVGEEPTYLPVQRKGGDKCSFEMVWYSAFACPLCTPDDYEQVPVSNCEKGTLVTWRHKIPKTCQDNLFEPLPANVPCVPCTPDDYAAHEGWCVDAQGQRNVTYEWKQPKTCDDAVDIAAKLPADQMVGPCTQRKVVVQKLGPKHIALFVLLGLLFLVMAVVALVTYLKNRRVYQMYSKLVEEEGAEEGDEDEEEDEEEEGDVESRRLNEGGASSLGTEVELGGRNSTAFED